MEILLTLALLVAIGALVAPSFTRPLDAELLKKSADVIRTEWGRARMTAMKTGQTQVCRFQLGTNLFEVAAWMTPEDYLEGDLQTAARQQQAQLAPPRASESAGQAGVDGHSPQTSQKSIHEKFAFLDLVGQLDSRGAAATQQLSLQAASSTWSSPVFFYPDGTSSSVQLLMGNPEQEQLIAVRLRGITGSAQVSDLLAPQEVPQ